MTGSERGYYKTDQSQEDEFRTLLTEIDSGIGWEEAGFLKVPIIIRTEINREIADHMHRLKRHLQLNSHPKIGLLQEWNELPPEDERIMDKIWGDAFLSKDIPQGRIRFSPKHIKESVTEKIGKVKIPVYPLGRIVAHEEFHIWQFINNPLQVQRDLKVMNRRDEVEEAWNYTNTEMQAGEFERYWIENWMNH